MTSRLVVACVLAAAALALGHPSPASAQAELGCADPDTDIQARIDGATTVFVGRVAALGNKGRTATVEVIRVWSQDTLPERVEVTGTIATQSKVVTALDRLYAREATYLFVPDSGASPRFRENRCSATRQLTPELAALAPADGGKPPAGEGVPLPGADLGKLVPLMIGVPVFLVLGGLVLAARRKTKAQRRPRAATGT